MRFAVVCAVAAALAASAGRLRAEELSVGGGQSSSTTEAVVSAAARAFAAPPAFYDMAVSPDGGKLARIAQRGGLYFVDVFETSDVTKPAATFGLSQYTFANWLRWKDNDRLLVGASIPSSRFGFLMWETRLWAFDAGLKNRVAMVRGSRRGARYYTAFQDRVLAVLPEDPNGVLIAFDWFNGAQPGVQRVDLNSGDVSTVRSGGAEIRDWLVDPDGQVFIGSADVEGQPRLYRATRGSNIAPVPLIGAGTIFDPLAFDGAQRRLAVASNHEGGTTGLYVYDLDRGFVETLYKSAEHDAEAVVLSPDSSRVDGVVWTDNFRRVRWLNDAARARHDRIVALTGGEDADVISQTPDGRFAVATTIEDARRGEAFLVDLTQGTSKSLGRLSPTLDAIPAGRVEAISFTAPDGLEIPGYLTLPPGIERTQARHLPFVILPHGGPHARDSADFDFLAQFFASRGYGVLQPNFRGSSGYGEAFLAAGDRQWSGAVLDDVAAGTRWAVSQGLADPSRICIVGWSSGGYLSLMSAAEHGDLYRCAAAVAPVTDIPALIQYETRFVGGRSAMSRMFGIGLRNHLANRRASPVARVRDMHIPIFLIAGSGDDVVPPHQPAALYAAARAAHIDFDYLDLPGAVHSVTREPDRVRLLAAPEGFVDRNTQPRSASASSGAF